MADRIAKLEKAFRQHPDLPLFARLADRYLRRGMVFKALDLCQKGCARFPEYAPGFFVLGRLLETRRDLEGARSAVGRALSLDAENPAGFKHLAAICEQLGDSDRARKALDRARRLDPLDEQVIEKLDHLEYSRRLEVANPRPVPYDELPDQEEVRAARGQQAEPSESPPPPEASDETDASDGQEPPGPPGEEGDVASPGPPDSRSDLEREDEDPLDAVADLARSVNMEDEPDRGPADSGLEDSGEAHELELIGLTAGEDQELLSVLHEIDASPQPAEAESAAPREPDAEPVVPPPEPEVESPASDASVTQIATATLAEIYSGQGFPERAIQIYERLLQTDPNNEKLRARMAELRRRSPAGKNSKA